MSPPTPYTKPADINVDPNKVAPTMEVECPHLQIIVWTVGKQKILGHPVQNPDFFVINFIHGSIWIILFNCYCEIIENNVRMKYGMSILTLRMCTNHDVRDMKQ